MFELLRIIIALAGTLAAGIWDFKTTDVPDRIVLPMIAFGFFLGAAEGVLTGNWGVFAQSIIISAAFLAFSLVMYFAGAWGGGDGALLIAVGSLLPCWPAATVLSFLPFPLAYFISVLVVGLVYSVLYFIAIMARSAGARAAFRREFSKVTLAYIPVAMLLLFFVTLIPDWLFLLLAAVLIAAPPIYALSNAAEDFFFRRIPSKKLCAGDMVGEDLPKLKIFKRQIRGLTEKEVSAIRKAVPSVLVRDGVRYGLVFFLALLPVLLALFL